MNVLEKKIKKEMDRFKPKGTLTSLPGCYGNKVYCKSMGHHKECIHCNTVTRPLKKGELVFGF
jgi:hypothetical protein